MEHNQITAAIIDCSMAIHSKLGPGLLESVYSQILVYELRKRDRVVEVEVPIAVLWDNIRFEIGFRADLIVDHQVLVELKAIETLAPVHKKQLLTYLRLADKRLGLLINFGAAQLKDGIVRIVNGFEE